MGLFTDANICEDCGEEIKDGERVIVSQVEGGNYQDSDGSVTFDLYPIELEIRHKQCWMDRQDDQQLPEKPCTDGSICVR